MQVLIRERAKIAYLTGSDACFSIHSRIAAFPALSSGSTKPPGKAKAPFLAPSLGVLKQGRSLQEE